jgi:hypothetical protein
MGLVLFLGSCDTGGESGEISEPTTPRPQLAQQAIANLLDLYRTALRQEDIDRLQDLLQPPGPSDQPPLQQANDEEVLDIERFRQLFRTRTMMALDIADSRISADRRHVTFQETESTVDLATLSQRTRLFHTTFELVEEANEGRVTFRIATIRRQGPHFEIAMPGQVLAETLTRITVSAPTGAVSLAAVTVDVPEMGTAPRLGTLS